MSPDAPDSYPAHAIEKASLDLIATFALAQEEATSGIRAYLDSKGVSDDVRGLVWRGSRMNDEDRMRAIILLARDTNYPLHERAFRDTYSLVKSVRDALAHGGPILAGQTHGTSEPFMWLIGQSPKAPEGITVGFHSLAEVRDLVKAAKWLYLVGWRIRSLITGEGVPATVRFPSDVPRTAVEDAPVDRTGWGEPPVCRYGHGNVVGVGTRYGDAWLCAHCDRVELRYEGSLMGSLSTLTESTPGER